MDFALGSTVSDPVGCGWFGAKKDAPRVMRPHICPSWTCAATTRRQEALPPQIPVPAETPRHATTPPTPSTSQILMAKSGTGNAHGAEFKSGREEITEKSLLGLWMQGQSCWGFRVSRQLFAVHSWELQLVLVDTPRGMLEYGGGIGSALALRMRWLGSRVLQWALLPVARAGD